MNSKIFTVPILIPIVLIVAGFVNFLSAQTNYWEPTTNFTTSKINDISTFGDDVIFAATQEDGIYHSTDQGDNWVQINSGLPFNFSWGVNAVECTDFMGNNKVYAGGDFDSLYKNSISGSTWEGVPGLYVLGIDGIYATGGNIYVSQNFDGGIYRSTDDGITWELQYDPLWGAHIISEIVSNPTIFAGSIGGGVFRSYDYSTWEAVNNGLSNDFIFCLEFDGSGNLFAGTGGGGVCRSTNDGDNWIVGNNGLPNLFITSMAINSLDHVFVGTYNQGVARSTDQGSNWTVLNSGLTDLEITALELNDSQRLFVGTASGMVYRSTGITEVKNEISLPIEYTLHQNYPNPFNPSTTISFSIPEASFVSLKIINSLGEEVEILISEELSAGNYDYDWTAENLSSGVYFYKLQTENFVETKKMILMK